MILDARVAFYLKHQALIEEWAALKRNLHGEAHRFFCRLEPEVRAAAVGLAGAPLVFVELESDYPKLFLYRERWSVPSSPGRPRAAVGIEWSKRQVTFDNAYMGVWVDQTLNGGSDLGLQLGALFKERDLLLRGNQPTSWWPARRGVQPPLAEYWSDLPTFAQAVVSSLHQHWDHFSGAISEALGVEG